MIFTLVYNGDLPPNGSSKAKWKIRTAFDQQMRNLWKVPPLKGIDNYKDKSYQPADCYLGRSVHGIEFISPVSEKIKTIASLDILLLSAGEGNAVTVKGGDIDNRLKTLLDALRAPSNDQEIPENAEVPEDNKLFCLLDDDKLVDQLSVRIGRLLTASDYSNDAQVVIDARIKASDGIMANLGIVL